MALPTCDNAKPTSPPPKKTSKMPENAAYHWCADVLHLGAPEPLSLCYISHISGGEDAPNFIVLGATLCQAFRRRHGRNAKGLKKHL